MSMEERNVFSMLELSVKGQHEMSNTLIHMFEAIKELASKAETASETAQSAVKEAKNAVAEAQTATNEARLIREEVNNSVWLFPAESGTLHDTVRDRSIDLAKMNQISEESFPTAVGKIRRRIWSDLKKRYGVAKYIYIPHKDFNDAMNFVRGFSLVE